MLEIVTSLSHLLIAFAFSLKHFDTSLIAGSEETSAGFLLRHALKVGLPKPFLWQEKACGCNREGLTSQVSTRPFLGHLFGGAASGTRGSPYDTSLRCIFTKSHHSWGTMLEKRPSAVGCVGHGSSLRSLYHTFFLCPHFLFVLEMLLMLKIAWLKVSSHTPTLQTLLEERRVQAERLVLPERELWLRHLISCWIVNPVPVVRVDVIKSTGGRVSQNEIFLKKGFKMFGPETFWPKKGVFSVQNFSSLKACTVCYSLMKSHKHWNQHLKLGLF